MSELLPLEQRLDIITGVLERAKKYQTGLIVFIVFKSETTRADVENKLINWLTKTDQQAKKIQFRLSDPPEKAGLMGDLRADPPASNEVVFLYDIRHAFPGLLNSLNYRREFVPDNRWRLIFWVREEEIIEVMRGAPDFWAFTNQTIELPEIPPPVEHARRAESLAWNRLEWGDEFRRLTPDERQTRIALRERLLADLPDDKATVAARAELCYVLGVLYMYDRKFDKAEQSLQIALDMYSGGDNKAKTYNGLGNIYNNQGRYEEAIQAYQKAIELDPKDAYPHNNLGNVYKNQGRYEEAIQVYQKAIELNPKFAYPHNGLGIVYGKQGRYEEAIQSYQKAIELDPKFTIAYNGLGSVYIIQGRYEEAIQAFQQAIELDPKFTIAYNGLASVYTMQGKNEEAIQLSQQAIALDTTISNGLNFVQDKEHSEKIMKTLLEQFISNFVPPEMTDVLNLDDIYNYMGGYDTFQAIIHNPKLGNYINLGIVYDIQGRYEEAIQSYQKAIELDPKFAYPHNGLGNIYDTQGRYEEAIQAYQKAIELDPKDAYPYHGLGNTYHIQGRYEEAIQAYQKAIELDPKDATAYNNLGYVYDNQGRYEEAIQAYQKVIELDPKDATAYNGLGYVYNNQGRYEEAIQAYQKAIELDPKFVSPHSNLGYIYRDQERHKEATQSFQQAIEIDPKDANPHKGLGTIYSYQGLYEEAIQSFQQAIKLKPNYGIAHMLIAVILKQTGREVEATKYLATARELMQNESAYNKACLEAISGNIETALDYLAEEVALNRDWAKHDPDLASLRDHPRFLEIVGE